MATTKTNGTTKVPAFLQKRPATLHVPEQLLEKETAADKPATVSAPKKPESLFQRLLKSSVAGWVFRL
jgi:hypothetical protein